MFITGIGTATPPARFAKAECLSAFEQSDWFARRDARAHYVARSVLQRDNGIDLRQLAVDTLHQRFLSHAPRLALQAARSIAWLESASFINPAQRYSAAMLRQYGNLSSASVYFVLQAAVADEAPGGYWWLSSFGAGFSCHGALRRVD